MTISIVIARNDLEAEEIARLAESAGPDGAPRATVYEVDRGWGRHPGAGEPSLPDTGPILAVECPNPAWETLLIASGRTLHRIDHHIHVAADGRGVEDRSHPLASIEQVARLLEVNLEPVARWAAANDRGFWTALLSAITEADAEKALATPARPWLAGACGALTRLKDAWEAAGGTPGKPLETPARVAVALAVRLRDAAIRDGATEAKTLDRLADALRFLAGARQAGRRQCLDGRRGSAAETVELIHADRSLAPFVLDALYLERLFLGRGEPGPIRATVLSGPQAADGTPTVEELFHSGSEDDLTLARDLLNHLTGDAPSEWRRLAASAGGGGGSGFLSVRTGAAGRAEDLSGLADLWLNNLLGVNRPLWRWTTRMFQAIDYAPAAPGDPAARRNPALPRGARAGVEPASIDAQEHAYLMAHLRPFLAPCAPGGDALDGDGLAIRSFRLTAPADARRTVTVTWPDNRTNRIIEEPLREVLVHFCYNRIAIVEWSFGDHWEEFERKAEGKDCDDRPLWRRLLAGLPHADKPERVATLGQLLDFNAAARQCYAPYAKVRPEDKPDHVVTLSWDGDSAALAFPAPVISAEPECPDGWLALLAERALAPFGLSVADGDAHLLADERARIITGAALVGAAPTLPSALARQEALFARLIDVASAGETLPYDPAFNRKALDELAYRRFDSQGSLFGVDDHAFVLLGYGWFPAHIILPRHMEAVYRRLWLVAQYYSAVFCKFSRSITQLSRQRLELEARDGPREKDPAAWDALVTHTHDERVRFLGFANALWFETISSQMQGGDLFTLMTRRLRLREQYVEIRAELDRTDALESGDHARDGARRAEKLGVLAGLAAGFYITIDTLNNLFPGHGSVGVALLMFGAGLPVGWLAAVIIDRFVTGASWCEATRNVRGIVRRLLSCGR